LIPRGARLDRDRWWAPAGSVAKARSSRMVTARTTRAVTGARRFSAQTRPSWQTQEPVPASNTPAPLLALYQVVSAKLVPRAAHRRVQQHLDPRRPEPARLDPVVLVPHQSGQAAAGPHPGPGQQP
jgi:hypothetical protein